jgi:hypothetical protein
LFFTTRDGRILGFHLRTVRALGADLPSRMRLAAGCRHHFGCEIAPIMEHDHVRARDLHRVLNPDGVAIRENRFDHWE